MKDSLVNLLFEEFKQECLFEELEQKGIDLTKVSVQIYDIVLDLIGFPKDNTKNYDFNALNGLEHNPKLGKLPDDDLCCRDWLYDKYYDTIQTIEKKQKIEVTDKGLKMIEYNDEELIKSKLNDFVDWLYLEYSNI
ncbi:hypothetical protein H9I45_01270 [Polaribacter haliotis]|uniref:Uncharacterized protein n=1 Tax=Polaribacter haliotis TaxID=1888915 RepID=A0A7L8AGG5_9FLAO|nr:hypothetical protein [Polaribacter haliotis]QOD61101.1 hypothetical protein H9I45_01270 [Polaribacter haliotis]